MTHSVVIMPQINISILGANLSKSHLIYISKGTNNTSEVLYSLSEPPGPGGNLTSNLEELGCISLYVIALASIKSWFYYLQFHQKFIWIKFFLLVILQIVIFYADLVKDVLFIAVYVHYVTDADNFRFNFTNMFTGTFL